MKTTRWLCIALIISLALVPLANCSLAETTIEYYGGIDSRNEGLKEFLASHKEVKLQQSKKFYFSTGEIGAAFITRDFKSNLFEIDTYFWESQQIMKKGYCVDLTDNSIIAKAMSEMYPQIAEQGMYEGKIFAVPHDLRFYYMQINEQGWQEAGLTERDIPDSFPALLDFLGKWCEREETKEYSNVQVMLSFDPTVYDSGSYTAWLTGLLIENHIAQSAYANKPLRFNEPNFIALLKRCQIVGRKLYNLYPEMPLSGFSGDVYTLFEHGLQIYWPKKADHVLYCRLDESQPKLMNASVDMYAINPLASDQNLTIELLEKLVTGFKGAFSVSDALLYTNAEPVVNPNAEESLQHYTQRAALLKEQLKNDELPQGERYELEKDLRYAEMYIKELRTEAGWYDMSPSQLVDYAQRVPYLNFSPPGIFKSSQDSSSTMQTLLNQFAAGVLDADQLLNELDRMARMMELERE